MRQATATPHCGIDAALDRAVAAEAAPGAIVPDFANIPSALLDKPY